MEMNKPEYHVVSLSGGKDSTAMLLMMLERGMRIDCILFCDTGLEFPGLYAHLDKLEQYIGRPITRIRAEHSFEYFFCQHRIRRKRSTAFAEKYGADHLGYGWAGPKMRWCTERLKNEPREQYLRKLRETYTVIEYVGLAADEGYRMERKNNQNPNHRHPLIDWNVTEAECLQYCHDHGFDWGGLYEIFHRVSCWCCPLQSLSELRKLYHHFPELWEQLKKWDGMTWRNFRADCSVIELEKRFDFEEEWQKAGKPLRSKAFYSALKSHLSAQTGKEDA